MRCLRNRKVIATMGADDDSDGVVKSGKALKETLGLLS